jgi:pyruvate/2-oxoglutarate dehydrogenase complex dihydrolipoamide acyltransferase (E2) component
MAREMGVNLGVQGSGPRGRIAADIRTQAAQTKAPIRARGTLTIPLTAMRRTI